MVINHAFTWSLIELSNPKMFSVHYCNYVYKIQHAHRTLIHGKPEKAERGENLFLVCLTWFVCLISILESAKFLLQRSLDRFFKNLFF